HWGSIPIVRIPNLSLMPGSKPLTLEELISDTKDGIYIEGMGSFSIDQMRCNFQFGGDGFWEIKNGRITGMLKNVTYQSRTTEVSLQGVSQASTRFANNVITQNLAKSNQTLTVKSAFGNRVGKASTNDLSDAALRGAVERSESIARLSEPDTEYLPPPGQPVYA